MATNGYATLAELKTWLRIPDTTDDVLLDALIDSSSRWIDYHCRRAFSVSGSTARYFTPHCSDVVLIDDAATVTAVATDDGEDGSYENTWASTDYFLEPAGNNLNGAYHPFTAIHVTRPGSFRFPTARRGLKVTGTWGWTSVPHPIRDACLMLASRLYKRGESPLGQLETPELGSVQVVADTDLKLLLAPFVCSPVIG